MKNKKFLLIPIVIIVILLVAFYFFGKVPENVQDKTRSGFIGNEIWSGTINVMGDLIVHPWATLTIKPGTTIYVNPIDNAPKFSTEVLPDGFNDNDPTRLKEYEDTHITISGKIIALGTKDKPIIFTSASQNPKIADWSQLNLDDGSRLDHVIVEYLRTPSANGDDIEITNSIFRHVMWGGISLADKSSRIINNTIYDCGHEGLDVHGGEPYIANNFIYECNTGIVVITDYLEVVPGYFFKGRSNPTVVNNTLLNNGHGIYILNSGGTYINNTITSPVGPKNDWCYEDFCYKNMNYGNAISVEGNSSPVFINNLFANRTVEKPGEPKLNIIEKTNLSEKDLTYISFDVSSYQDFIKNNIQYSKPISEEELERQIDQARAYLADHPQGKIAENLREQIIQELNIGFILEGINQRELVVTTIAVRQYEKYNEKELLFEDPQVGTFSVLLLIPEEGESHPAILGLHGHGDSKEVFKRKFFGEKLAEEGFVVIMPSFRDMNCDEIEKNISKELLFEGFTLMGLRVYETHLLIKYLKHTDFVDKDRIGIIGHSGGGEIVNLISRVSPDLKAGVYDFSSDLLDMCDPIDPRIHCQTIPTLGYYSPQINNNSTVKIPLRKFDYGYPGLNDKQEVINFFKENLK